VSYINKRQIKKKAMKRYYYGIELLAGYCNLSKETVIREVKEDLMELALDINDWENDLEVYLDNVSIDLMLKHKTGWAWNEMGSGLSASGAYKFLDDEGEEIDELYKDYI
jgi:hypothetical protein